MLSSLLLKFSYFNYLAPNNNYNREGKTSFALLQSHNNVSLAVVQSAMCAALRPLCVNPPHHINILFIWPALIAHVFNPSTRKAETGGLLLVCLGFDFLVWFGLVYFGFGFWFLVLVLVSPGYPGTLWRSSWPQIQNSLCLFLPGAWIKSYHIQLYFLSLLLFKYQPKRAESTC